VSKSESKSPSVVVLSDADELKKLLGTSAPPEKDAEETGPVVTHHVLEHPDAPGGRLSYTATAGRVKIAVKDKPDAELYIVSYVATTDGAADVDRPVTFAFNGGPGSASLWLHLGFMGPVRVVGDVDSPPSVPARPSDNPHTLLTTTDLVFIDPVSTGFSKASSGDGSEFHGVKGDIESVAELVRRWVSENGRWGSPKYLAGESYGTTRGVGVAHRLQEKYGLYLNGLVLISLVLKFDTLLFNESHWLPYAMIVPTAAATAHYHGRVDAEDVWALHRRAERFVYETFVPALMLGDRLSEQERADVARELAGLLGLSPAYVESADLRVGLGRFCRELLRDQAQTVGRLDSRFVGREKDAAGEGLEHDPTLGWMLGAYTAAMQHHLHHTLGVTETDPYEVLNRDVWPWRFDDTENHFLDFTGKLREAMQSNPHLKVFVASGLYDLATPWMAAEYTLSQLQVGAECRQAIQSHCYPAGHMMYIHEDSATQLRADLEAFYTASR
jgi:carboxypeptidase C (cathepsin A)